VCVSRFEIDVVEAGAAQRHKARSPAGKPGQNGGIELIVHEHANSRIAGREHDGRLIEARLQEREIVAEPRIGARKRVAVVGFGAEHSDAH
jgi:hypothetical protein